MPIMVKQTQSAIKVRVRLGLANHGQTDTINPIRVRGSVRDRGSVRVRQSWLNRHNPR